MRACAPSRPSANGRPSRLQRSAESASRTPPHSNRRPIGIRRVHQSSHARIAARSSGRKRSAPASDPEPTRNTADSSPQRTAIEYSAPSRPSVSMSSETTRNAGVSWGAASYRGIDIQPVSGPRDGFARNRTGPVMKRSMRNRSAGRMSLSHARPVSRKASRAPQRPDRPEIQPVHRAAIQGAERQRAAAPARNLHIARRKENRFLPRKLQQHRPARARRPIPQDDAARRVNLLARQNKGRTWGGTHARHCAPTPAPAATAGVPAVFSEMWDSRPGCPPRQRRARDPGTPRRHKPNPPTAPQTSGVKGGWASLPDPTPAIRQHDRDIGRKSAIPTPRASRSRPLPRPTRLWFCVFLFSSTFDTLPRRASRAARSVLQATRRSHTAHLFSSPDSRPLPRRNRMNALDLNQNDEYPVPTAARIAAENRG